MRLVVAESGQAWTRDLALLGADIDIISVEAEDEARTAIAHAATTAYAIDINDPDLAARASMGLALAIPVIVVGDTGGKKLQSKHEGMQHVVELTREALTTLQSAARQDAPGAADLFEEVDATTDSDAHRDAAIVGVIGGPGSGTSITAMALAAGMAQRGADVILIDGCRRSDMAMLHGHEVADTSVLEVANTLVGQPATDAFLDRAAPRDPDRGYRIIQGLRTPAQWTQWSSVSLAAMIQELRTACDIVVVDLDPDVDGADETGSFDLEDRHGITRAVLASADHLVVTIRGDVVGVHQGLRLIDELVPQIDGAGTSLFVTPSTGRPRRVARSVDALLPDGMQIEPLPRIDVDRVLLANETLDEVLIKAVTRRVAAELRPRDRSGPGEPQAISPGSLDGITGDAPAREAA